MRKTCGPCGARHVQNVVVVTVGLQIALTLVRSRIESLFLPRFIAETSRFNDAASLNRDVSTSLQGEQLDQLIDRWRRQLLPSMLTYTTSNDHNLLSLDSFYFTKKASSFRLKKHISIDFWSEPDTEEWRECSHWKLVGWNKDHNNAELHAAEVKGQCCDSL